MRKQCMKQYLHQKKGGKVTPLNSAKFGQKQRIGNEGWKFQKFVLYTPELSSNFQNSTQHKHKYKAETEHEVEAVNWVGFKSYQIILGCDPFEIKSCFE